MYLKVGENAIVAGGIARDAELAQVGEKKTNRCKFSVAYGRKDGETVYANCVAWRELALIASEIKRGDYVLAAGHIEEREYQGRVYKTLSCDFVQIADQMQAVKLPQPVGELVDNSDGFKPVDDDDLPF